MTSSPVGLHEFNRIVRITLLVPVTVLAILAGLLVWQVEQALDLRQHSIIDSQVIDQVLTLQQHVTDQETGLRAYQLTGLPSVLLPYQQLPIPDRRRPDRVRTTSGRQVFPSAQIAADWTRDTRVAGLGRRRACPARTLPLRGFPPP